MRRAFHPVCRHGRLHFQDGCARALAIKIPSTYPLAGWADPLRRRHVRSFDGARRYDRHARRHRDWWAGRNGREVAKALGCVVTAVSRSPKRDTRSPRADHFIASTDKAMRAAAGSLDLVLNTIPAMHDYTVYEALVSPLGKHVTLGANAVAGGAIYAAKIVGEAKMRTVFSAIGGIKNTQAVVDLCDKAKIYPETKVMPVSALSEIYEALDSNNDAGIRYVLDIGTTLTEDASGVHRATAEDAAQHRLRYGRIVFEVPEWLAGPCVAPAHPKHTGFLTRCCVVWLCSSRRKRPRRPRGAGIDSLPPSTI